MSSLYHILYDMLGFASFMDFFSEGISTFQKASRPGIRQGTFEIVIEEVLWSILGSYQTI